MALNSCGFSKTTMLYIKYNTFSGGCKEGKGIYGKSAQNVADMSATKCTAQLNLKNLSKKA